MIQINLSWLAIPCYLYAGFCFAKAIYAIAMTYNGPDIAPMIGIAIAMDSCMYMLVAFALGFLIERAFKK